MKKKRKFQICACTRTLNWFFFLHVLWKTSFFLFQPNDSSRTSTNNINYSNNRSIINWILWRRLYYKYHREKYFSSEFRCSFPFLEVKFFPHNHFWVEFSYSSVIPKRIFLRIQIIVSLRFFLLLLSVQVQGFKDIMIVL